MLPYFIDSIKNVWIKDDFAPNATNVYELKFIEGFAPVDGTIMFPILFDNFSDKTLNDILWNTNIIDDGTLSEYLDNVTLCSENGLAELTSIKSFTIPCAIEYVVSVNTLITDTDIIHKFNNLPSGDAGIFDNNMFYWNDAYTNTQLSTSQKYRIYEKFIPDVSYDLNINGVNKSIVTTETTIIARVSGGGTDKKCNISVYDVFVRKYNGQDLPVHVYQLNDRYIISVKNPTGVTLKDWQFVIDGDSLNITNETSISIVPTSKKHLSSIYDIYNDANFCCIFTEGVSDLMGKVTAEVMGGTLTNNRFGSTNSAYYFDGSETNKIKISTINPLNISGDFSIFCILNNLNPTGLDMNICCTMGFNDLGFETGIDNLDFPYFHIYYNEEVYSCNSLYPVVDGVNYLVFQRKGNVQEIWINGSLCKSFESVDDDLTNNTHMMIAICCDDVSKMFSGVIDAIMGWGRSLSSQEIAMLLTLFKIKSPLPTYSKNVQRGY